MERLTERFNNGQAAVLGCGNNCKYDYKYCHNAYEDCPTINEIYERLATYEDTKLIPEQFAELDSLYLEKCQEVNRLTAELAELKKQPQGDLISREALIKAMYEDGAFPLSVADKALEKIEAAPTAYDVEKVVEQMDRKSFEAAGFIVVERKEAIDIVRNGGKE